MSLRQADEMTVDQYVAKFIELSRYSFYLQRYDDEPWRCEQFETGLKPLISDRVTPQRIRKFSTLVEANRVIENNLRAIMPAAATTSQKGASEMKRPRSKEGSSMTPNTKRRGKRLWN